ncbi:hypothetical protein FKM82_018158 [Ascaphus truei]
MYYLFYSVPRTYLKTRGNSQCICNRGLIPVHKGASNPAVWWLTAGSKLTSTTCLITGSRKSLPLRQEVTPP